MNIIAKNSLRQKRRWRIRKKVRGTAERPRVVVHFSNKHIYAQAIDDTAAKTLLYVSSLAKDLRDDKIGPNIAGSEKLAKVFGEKAKSAGLSKITFDRAGRRYHGKVKTFADELRAAGLEF
ncbi:MAG: 50S ribosomal protein L18 [Opitutales bacterium]|nr:50S ribosomal protein L18 [Opitutales bacterium]